jgi:hypothetical protein
MGKISVRRLVMFKLVICFFGVMGAMMFLMGTEQYAVGQRTDVDSGIIMEIVGNLLHVQGERGDHIFELLGGCSWCEEGEAIAAVFQGVTRVELVPDPNRLKRPPVKGFIVRDGRREF